MRRRRIVLGTAAGLLLISGGSVIGKVVAVPLDSGGAIHGCGTNTAVNASHAIVLQDAGTTCPRGTTAIT